MAKRKPTKDDADLLASMVDENPTSGIETLGGDDYAIFHEEEDPRGPIEKAVDNARMPQWAAGLHRAVDESKAHSVAAKEALTQLRDEGFGTGNAIAAPTGRSGLWTFLSAVALGVFLLAAIILWYFLQRGHLLPQKVMATAAVPANISLSEAGRKAIDDSIAQVADGFEGTRTEVAGLVADIQVLRDDMGAMEVKQANGIGAFDPHPPAEHKDLSNRISEIAAAVSSLEQGLNHRLGEMEIRLGEVEHWSHSIGGKQYELREN